MLGNKKTELTKKDMNFFSDFTTSSTQVASAMSLILVIFAIVFVLAVGLFLLINAQSAGVQKEINEIKNEMSSEYYTTALDDYYATKLSMESRREYLFVLTSLQARMADKVFAETKYMDIINDNIPENVSITAIKYEDGAISVSGTCETHSAALEMAAKLQEMNTFTYVNINSIIKKDWVADGVVSIEATELWQYTFTFTGSLLSEYPVIVNQYVNDETASPLSAASMRIYPVGESYGYTDITQITVDGVNYTLSKVLINETPVQDDVLARIISTDSITGKVTGKVSIKLLYDVAAEKGGDQS